MARNWCLIWFLFTLITFVQSDVYSDEQEQLNNQRNAQNITIGDNVQLTCTIMFAANYDMELSKNETYFSWNFVDESQNTKELSSNGYFDTSLQLATSEEDFVYNQEVIHVKSTYTIANAQKRDEGTYKCTAHFVTVDKAGPAISSILVITESKRVRVNTPEGSKIELDISCDHFTAEEGDTVRWNGNVDQSASLTWFGYDISGKEMNMVNYDKDRFLIRQTAAAYTLDILNATASDPAYYSLRAAKGPASKIINMALALTNPKTILGTKMFYDEPRYLEHETDRIAHCSMQGKRGEPRRVEIFQQDCRNYVNVEDCFPAKMHYIYNVPEGTQNITLRNWEKTTTGRLTCQQEGINSTQASSETRSYYCVTDYKSANHTFAVYYKGNVTLNKREIKIDEDNKNLVLSCLASYCDSTSYKVRLLQWSFRSFNQITQLQNLYSLGESSVRADIVLNNLTMAQGGEYICTKDNSKIQIYVDMGQTRNDAPIVGDEPEDASSITIAIICIIIGLLLACAVVIIYLVKENKRKRLEDLQNREALEAFQRGDIEAINKGESMYAQADLLPFGVEWVFPRDKLSLGRRLGAGNFGMVFEADAEGLLENEETTKVAVKTIQKKADPDEAKAFEKEVKIMANLPSHPHVVNMLGAVVDRIATKEIMLIVEYCKYGCLLEYLKENKDRFVDLSPTPKIPKPIGQAHTYNNTEADALPFDTKVLGEWAYQIARGMEWLASKKIVHCDLAARNVLLCEQNLVKICDFGLAHNLYTKSEYTKQKGKKLPLCWMALESIEYRKFTSQSDVWSYGIVLWETYTMGKVPYSGRASFNDVWKELLQGFRLEKPEYASKEMYDIMMNCWKEDPAQRPTFTDLTRDVLALSDSRIQSKLVQIEEGYKGATPRSKKVDYNDSPAPLPTKRRLINPPSYMNGTYQQIRSLFERRRPSTSTRNNYSVAYVPPPRADQDELLLPSGFENPNAKYPGKFTELNPEGYGSIRKLEEKSPASKSVEMKIPKEVEQTIPDTKAFKETEERKISDPVPPIPPKVKSNSIHGYTEPRPVIVEDSTIKKIVTLQDRAITTMNQYSVTPESYLDPIAEIPRGS